MDEQVTRWGESEYWDTVRRAIAPLLAPAEERLAFARVLRFSETPGDARVFLRTNMEIDVRHVLPSIQTPTLVLAREGWGDEVARARYHAEQIPNAQLVVLPGPTGSRPSVTRGHRRRSRLLPRRAPRRSGPEPERVLATVLFTDVVGSTERAAELGDAAWRNLLRSHHGLVRRALARYRGREMDTAGDGFFATFDGPARAIRCACAVRDAVRELDLEIPAGLHAGECELLDGKAAGIAVSIDARVVASTARGERCAGLQHRA